MTDPIAVLRRLHEGRGAITEPSEGELHAADVLAALGLVEYWRSPWNPRRVDGRYTKLRAALTPEGERALRT